MEKLTAIIAGTGSLPIEACKSLRAKNKPFFVISLFPEDNSSDLEKVVLLETDLVKTDFCKASEILRIIKERDGKQVLLIGKVDKKNMLKKLKLDWLAIKSIKSLFSRSDKSLMEKVLSIFSENGIDVIHQSDVLEGLIISPGILTGALTDSLQRDIHLGLDIALKISKIDIGQTVVMKDGMILAIEAIEGTDECIQRGISLGGKGIVACKGARKNQNKKYDLPTLGPATIEKINKGEIAAIAWQSSQTLIADKENFIRLAIEKNITLVSV